jgi:hypothetical protein
MVLGEMESVVAGEIDRAQVRLAELVAALSLGIDLGFGQPMEHVFRQCLIAGQSSIVHLCRLRRA